MTHASEIRAEMKRLNDRLRELETDLHVVETGQSRVTLINAQMDVLHGLRRIGEDAYPIIHANGHDLYESSWIRDGWHITYGDEE